MYDQAFYDLIAEGCRRSAEVIVPLVLGERQFGSVIDVGCGQGWWGKAFADRGCEVVGIDGDYVRDPVIDFRAVDLAQSYRGEGLAEWDLAVCLEVAEHLPPARAESFIADLCSLAPTVLFSAAIPGQGGVNHLNEQWPGYWVELFERHGYTVSGALRWRIWSDERVENWYRQNLLIASSEPERCPTWFDTPLAPPWPVIHPVLWESRR